MAKKRLASLLLALALVLSLLPAAALAEEPEFIETETVYAEIEYDWPVLRTRDTGYGTGTNDDGILGKHLTEPAQSIYNLLVANRGNLSNFEVNSTNLSGVDLKALWGDLGPFRAALSCLNYDYPDVFWYGAPGFSMSGTKDNTGTLTSVTSITLQWENALDWNTGGRTLASDRDQLEKAVTAMADNAKKENRTTQYEQLKYVHDQLVTTNHYNKEAADDSTYSTTVSDTPWTALSALG